MSEENLTGSTEMISTPPEGFIPGPARNSIGQIKRFMERWNSDPQFRGSLKETPLETLSKYNILVDYDVVEPLLRDRYFERMKEIDSGQSISPALERYSRYMRGKLAHREAVRMQCVPQEPRLRAWRERQILRGDKQFGPLENQSLVHATFSLELSKGCSVGCWFCAVSAPKLTDLFLYDSQNQKTWIETLMALKQVVGGNSYGFCYWATDPFDNPDYEKFLLDFHGVFGYLPQTTTALPMKDPARTRTLLKLSEKYRGIHSRFSVITLGMLNRIHQEFDADELLTVECLPLNRESQRPKANAGRYRDYSFKNSAAHEMELAKNSTMWKSSGNPEQNGYSPSTIACVSGFLINMVDRTVKLISPCPADDQWPLGYIIFDEKTFRDPSEFSAVIQKMITDHMPETVMQDDVVTLSAGQDFRMATGDIANSSMTHYFHTMGDLVKAGTHTAGKIALLLFYNYGVSPETTLEHLNSFLEKGLLEIDRRL